MRRYVLTVNLRDDPGAISAYREHHRRVWPEVVDSLRRSGVKALQEPSSDAPPGESWAVMDPVFQLS